MPIKSHISVAQSPAREKKTYLNVSDVFLDSTVLDGLMPLSKLKAFGLSECGDAVVEFAIHILESASVFCRVAFDVVVEV